MHEKLTRAQVGVSANFAMVVVVVVVVVGGLERPPSNSKAKTDKKTRKKAVESSEIFKLMLLRVFFTQVKFRSPEVTAGQMT